MFQFNVGSGDAKVTEKLMSLHQQSIVDKASVPCGVLVIKNKK